MGIINSSVRTLATNAKKGKTVAIGKMNHWIYGVKLTSCCVKALCFLVRHKFLLWTLKKEDSMCK